MPRVVVVGAGPGGLAVAFRLRQLVPGVDLTVLDAGPRPGGNVWTEDADGFRVEHGPNGFLDGNPATVRLARDLGLGDRLVAASEGSRKNRYVYAAGKVHKLPGSPLGLLATPLLSPAGKLSLLAEPFRRRPPRVPADETVGAFARRRFGREAAGVFVDALVTGIHAGDPDKLSVKAAFPRLAEFERDAGSVFRGFLRAAKKKKAEAGVLGAPPTPQRMWSFPDGLKTLVDALVAGIGVPVLTGVRVRRVERSTSRGVDPHGWTVRGDGRDSWPADAVVLACPAPDMAGAVADLDPGLAGDLAGVGYNKVAVVALGYRQADVPGAFDGFGYIAPGSTRRDVLGVQWCSSIFPGRAPPGFVLWRALCGGASRPDVFALPDGALVRACHRELQHALGVAGDPVFRRVVRWPRAIPQYHVGHPARVARADAAVGRHPGLFVAGNALHGVALNDVTDRAAAVAGAVAAYLTGRRGDGVGR